MDLMPTGTRYMTKIEGHEVVRVDMTDDKGRHYHAYALYIKGISTVAPMHFGCQPTAELADKAAEEQAKRYATWPPGQKAVEMWSLGR